MIYLDTHVVAWLRAGRLDLLSEKAIRAIEKSDLLISPICELELQYLFETGKIREDAKTIMAELGSRIGLKICSEPFQNVIPIALRESWTRDPFDRIITAHARLRASHLITKDRLIQKH